MDGLRPLATEVILRVAGGTVWGHDGRVGHRQLLGVWGPWLLMGPWFQERHGEGRDCREHSPCPAQPTLPLQAAKLPEGWGRAVGHRGSVPHRW